MVADIPWILVLSAVLGSLLLLGNLTKGIVLEFERVEKRKRGSECAVNVRCFNEIIFGVRVVGRHVGKGDARWTNRAMGRIVAVCSDATDS